MEKILHSNILTLTILYCIKNHDTQYTLCTKISIQSNSIALKSKSLKPRDMKGKQ